MKSIKYYTTLFILFLISLTTLAQGELDNYLQTAAENNPGVKAKFNEYMAALEKIPQAGALPDPTIAFGYFIRPVETRLGPQQARISISQMFPWFGTLGAQEDVAVQMAKAKYEMFEEAKSKLFYDVKSTWYDLYYTNKAIAITSDNIEILNTFQKLALVKIEAGKASATDELRVEMELLELQNQLKLLTDKLNSQEIAFNNLLNVNEQQQIIIPEQLVSDELNITREAILDSIRLNNHQVLSLKFQEASDIARQNVSKKMGNPKFTIGLDYNFIGQSDNSMLAPGESGRDAVMFPMVGISVPLNRKKYNAMVKEAEIMQTVTQDQKDDKENNLESIYEKANTDYSDAGRRIEMHTQQLDLAKRSMRILESEYATNGQNFEEILRMDRQVLLHSLELEKSRTDLNRSIAFINYLMGK